MKVEVKQGEVGEAGVDLAVVGLLEGAELPPEVSGAAGADAAKGGFKKLSLLRPDGLPAVLAVVLGPGDKLDAEGLRVAAAVAAKEAARLGATALAWALPEGIEPDAAAYALVTGTVLA